MPADDFVSTQLMKSKIIDSLSLRASHSLGRHVLPVRLGGIGSSSKRIRTEELLHKHNGRTNTTSGNPNLDCLRSQILEMMARD